MLQSHSKHQSSEWNMFKLDVLEDEHQMCVLVIWFSTHDAFPICLRSIGQHELTQAVANVHRHHHDTTANEYLLHGLLRGIDVKWHTHANAQIVGQTAVRPDCVAIAAREKRKLNFPWNQLAKIEHATFGYWFRSHRAHTMTLAAALRLHCSAKCHFVVVV